MFGIHKISKQILRRLQFVKLDDVTGFTRTQKVKQTAFQVFQVAFSYTLIYAYIACLVLSYAYHIRLLQLVKQW
jgi:hypothetical protein